jgi:hypothetical protein
MAVPFSLICNGRIIMRLGEFIACVAAAVVALSAPASAQEPGAGAASLRGTNCAQFIDAVATATAPARSDGKAASSEELDAATEAQDELIITLFWVHGYQAGKTGHASLLDQQWMARTVARMGEICSVKGNEKLPISEAVKQL